MSTRRAKPIQIIGDPDNQRPDKWSSTVFYNSENTKMYIFNVDLKTRLHNQQTEKLAT
jgi:hypothetical protein